MKNKELHKLVSLCLCFCMVCFPVASVNAQELKKDFKESNELNDKSFKENIPISNVDKFTSGIDKDDAYEEVIQQEDIEEYTKNNMDRAYKGENFSVTELPNDSKTFGDTKNQENTDPNYAYLVEHKDTVQGNLTKVKEMRWYGFILDKTSKVSIMLQSISSVDADLYLFRLDQNTNELNLIGGSANSGLGISEYSSNILEAGIYYFAVSSYEGSGQYAFAFYETQDLNNEVNDSISTAAGVGVNETIAGVIDSPFDQDCYTFTLKKPIIMNMSKNVGNYQFNFLNVDSKTKIYKISKKEEMYQFDAGTYCFIVYSKDGTYNESQKYNIKLNKIADIADDSNSFYYMVNEPAKIVFQSDPNGNNMYVNGNTIDIDYKYFADFSNSYGSQVYDIVMENSSNLRAKIYQDQFMFDDVETTIYYGMSMPDTVYYRGGSKGVGPAGNALELSLYSLDPVKFYRIHCVCSGAYAANRLYKDLNFATVFINPNTGKLVDIAHINYFYDYATGSNSMSFIRPNSGSTKYYYPYYNGEEPFTW